MSAQCQHLEPFQALSQDPIRARTASQQALGPRIFSDCFLAIDRPHFILSATRSKAIKSSVVEPMGIVELDI
jgi:hypothetical protein